MDENQNHIKSEVLELYKENRFLKIDAEAFRKSGGDVDKERLLLQLVLRIELHCAAPTPMVDTGVIMLIASKVDEEGKRELDYVLDTILRIENGFKWSGINGITMSVTGYS